jgi:hypothetical protein
MAVNGENNLTLPLDTRAAWGYIGGGRIYMAFKIEPEIVAGLCGTCSRAIVQTTASNRTHVICGGGEPTFVVREPLDRCSMYAKKEAPNLSKTFWLQEAA